MYKVVECGSCSVVELQSYRVVEVLVFGPFYNFITL